jgi:predicted MFS family arabinose efflux permease
VAQPILPLRLFSDRRRSAAYAARALYLGAMIGFFFFTTQLMQGVFGFSGLEAGLGFLPMTVVNFAVAMAVPRLNRRIDSATLLVTGVTLTLAGAAWLSQADAGNGYLVALALPMLWIGAGQGLAFAPLTSFGIVDARAEDAGAASGVVNTFHQLGMALGLAVLVAASAHTTDPADRFPAALMGSTALLAICLLVVLIVLAPAHRATVRTAARVRVR